MHQCREGWHLAEDPTACRFACGTRRRPRRGRAGGAPRRTRSTRRQDEVPDLPTVPVAHRTIGRTVTDPKTGRKFRPWMFITRTLPSSGLVIRQEGVPEPISDGWRLPTLGSLTMEAVRVWRAQTRSDGRSVGTASKSYRLLRAVLNTARDDGRIKRNPCRLMGADTAPAPERPVASVVRGSPWRRRWAPSTGPSS